MIEAVIDQVIAKLEPAGKDDLSGFFYDCDHYISMHSLFADVDVEMSDDVRCLLNANASVQPSVRTLHEISNALAQVWEEIYYNHFHAASCTWYRNRTELRFITVSRLSGYFVTGRISVTAPHQDRLVRTFKENFDFPGQPSAIMEG